MPENPKQRVVENGREYKTRRPATRHSPEPWVVVPAGIKSSIGKRLACGMIAKDAARAVACVNILAGVPNEVLTRILSGESTVCIRDPVFSPKKKEPPSEAPA